MTHFAFHFFTTDMHVKREIAVALGLTRLGQNATHAANGHQFHASNLNGLSKYRRARDQQFTAPDGVVESLIVHGTLENLSYFIIITARAIALVFNCFGLLIVLTGSAHAFKVTDDLEVIVTTPVSSGWVTVNFDNTYSNAVPVCVHRLPSIANPSAVVQVRSVGSTSMQIRLRQMLNSASVPTTDVHCIISDAGAFTLPDGTKYEARTILSTSTHGRLAANAWNTAQMQNATSLVTQTYADPVVLGQVMTTNSGNASVFFANDCESRANEPFQSGMADGICVGKHIGQISGSIANETLGFIVVDAGTGTVNNVQFQASNGPDNVAGTGNSPPYSHNTNRTYETGVATQSEEAGGDGGWAVLYGANPFAGAQLDLAIEEEVAARDTTRTHITEPVSWWVFIALPEITLAKTVDITTLTAAGTLTYTVTAENTGKRDLNGVVVIDTMPDGSVVTLSAPVESFAGGVAGVLEVGETWTYTATYDASLADMNAGVDLINSVTATATEYASESLAAETASATTVIDQQALLSVSKSHAFLTGAAPGSPGDVIRYTYVVTNTGNVTITNVQATDVHEGFGSFPAHPGNAVLTDNGNTGDSPDTNGDATIWGTLAPGDAVTFSADYTVVQRDVDELQ